MEASVDPECRGPDWMPITPKRGSLFHAETQVIDAGETRAAKIPESHNYLGFFGIAGPELLRRLSGHARGWGAELASGRVTRYAKKARPLSRRARTMKSMLASCY